jgi:peroxiredoxin Q/BCP
LPVEEGQPAPTFTLRNDGGEEVSLTALRGSPVILYFYPKDDSLSNFEVLTLPTSLSSPSC